MMTRFISKESLEAGKPFPLGVEVDQQGANFAVYAPHASNIELCFFDEYDQQTAIDFMPARTGDVWHARVNDVAPGQRYGYRVHGLFEPTQAFWFNPNKVIIDPYAVEISGPLEFNRHLFAHNIDIPGDIIMDEQDNAPYIPKARVPRGDYFEWSAPKPNISWREVIIYEMHVKGFSKLNQEVPEDIRGTYLGVAHPASIDYLKRLGITSVQILPCFAFMPESRLADLGLTNYWGYNPALFLAPEPRYAKEDAVLEFKTMVNALHQAGIEVIMDVVYNHTAESGMLGPVITNKGLHAREFFRYHPNNYTHFIDNSGCGNSVDTNHPYSLRLVMDSMRHWVNEFQIDGFRFDLAASLGREAWDYSRNSAFFKAIHQDPVLGQIKLIAEPWDIGRGGYQLGNFPEEWYECNDKFRDTVRRFWKGDTGVTADFATRIMGSNDVFHKGALHTSASVNYVTYHDGFTLHDLVSYNNRHNKANKEHNLDGHGNNLSYNYGVEGETDNHDIQHLRAKQKRNFIATMMLSQGAVHFLGGDEMGRTQQGNNNAYCQDSDISWFDWQNRDTKLEAFVRQIIALRKSSSLFNDLMLDDQMLGESPFTTDEVRWYRVDGRALEISDWNNPALQCIGMLLSTTIKDPEVDLHLCNDYYLVLFNASQQDVEFVLPAHPDNGWLSLCDTARNDGLLPEEPIITKDSYLQMAQSVVVLGKVHTA